MLYIDGNKYQHKLFGYLSDGVILCEIIGQSESQMKEALQNAKTIKFENADGVMTDYSKKHYAGVLDGADDGNVRILLK